MQESLSPQSQGRGVSLAVLVLSVALAAAVTAAGVLAVMQFTRLPLEERRQRAFF